MQQRYMSAAAADTEAGLHTCVVSSSETWLGPVVANVSHVLGTDMSRVMPHVLCETANNYSNDRTHAG